MTTRSEHTANQALSNAAQEHQRIIQVLETSKTVQRQRYQRVVKKQHNVVWLSVMLISSALIGALLAL